MTLDHNMQALEDTGLNELNLTQIIHEGIVSGEVTVSLEVLYVRKGQTSTGSVTGEYSQYGGITDHVLNIRVEMPTWSDGKLKTLAELADREAREAKRLNLIAQRDRAASELADLEQQIAAASEEK